MELSVGGNQCPYQLAGKFYLQEIIKVAKKKEEHIKKSNVGRK